MKNPSQHRPLFRLFGSKFRLVKQLPPPRGTRILENFAGGANYALRWCDYDVTLVEKEPLLAALWRFLLSKEAPEIVRSLPTFENCAGLDVYDWCERRGLPLMAGELVLRWARVGARGKTRKLSDWLGKNSGLWCAKTRDDIAETLPRIQHWNLHEGEFDDLEPDPEATLFCDPPYQHQAYTYGLPRPDYSQIAKYALDPRWKATISIEGEGADWLPFRPFYEVCGMAARTRGQVGKKSVDVVHFGGELREPLRGQ